jgi:hypothetical protein
MSTDDRVDVCRVMVECRLPWRELCALQARGEFPQALDSNGNAFSRADIERWKRERAATIWDELGK